MLCRVKLLQPGDRIENTVGVVMGVTVNQRDRWVRTAMAVYERDKDPYGYLSESLKLDVHFWDIGMVVELVDREVGEDD